MKIIITLILGCFVLLFRPSYSQHMTNKPPVNKVKPSLLFEKTEHHFGQIKEINGVINTIFRFTNQSDTIVHIMGTWAGCGCTVSRIAQKTLTPGASSVLRVQYNPIGRAGKFRKKIRVLGKGIRGKAEVFISGEVLQHPYPIVVAGTRWKTSLFAFNSLSHAQADTVWIPLVNIDSTATRIDQSKLKLPKGAKLLIPFDSLKPKQEGRLGLVWDTPLANQWGFVYHRFTLPLLRGKTKKDSVYLVMTAEVKEDFTLAKLSGKQAQVHLTQNNLDLGEILSNQPKMGSFQLTNQGNEVLYIRQVKTSCACLKVTPESDNLAPGSNTHLWVSYTPLASQKGKQQMIIMLTVNDPEKPEIRLRVTAQIKKKTK